MTPTPSLPPLLTPGAGEPLSFSLDWWFNANGHLTAATIMYLDGQPAYLLASLGRTVYALTNDGQVRWQARTIGPVYALDVWGEGWIVAGDDAGHVTLFDGNGRRLWRTDLGSRITAVEGGWQSGLLAGGWDKRLTFLDGDGVVRWQADLEGPVSDIAAQPGLALAATLDGQIQAFDPAGAEMWRFEAGEGITRLRSFGVEQDLGVLAGTRDGHLLLLDWQGAQRWARSLGEGGPFWDVVDLVGDAVPEIVVGMGGTEPVLALLSAAGEVLWRVDVPAAVGAVTALDLDDDGALEIVVGLANDEVQVYDALGRQRGVVNAGLAVWGLEAAEDGSVLVLADVVAWQIDGVPGSAGGSWLHPPVMVQGVPGQLPSPAGGTESQAIVVFLGDVAPGRSMEAQLARYGPAYPWEGLEPLLQQADLAVGNLECVLTTQGEPLNKSYLIRAHPRWGRTLVEGGLDLVTVANNHALDYGQVGLDETLDTLDALGLGFVGAGRSREEAHRPAIFELNGVRVAFLGYAANRWNGSVDVPATENIAWAEPAAVQDGVRAALDQADFVVVLLHAGVEYAAEPSPDQVAVAHAAVDAGADLVVGHHPHVTQTVERYKQGLIVYSLGDALFDIPRPAAMRGDLLRIHITPEGLVQAELWPFWIDDAIRPRLLDDGQGNPRYRVVYPQ